jgi:acyl-CoA thioester hydrolase
MPVELKERILIPIHFSEVDVLNMVWHGHYIRYMEDGREAFGKKYDLGYRDMYNKGFLAPIVKLETEYKRQLTYHDSAIVETTFIDDRAAKIIFDYKIYKVSDESLVFTARTIQVFLSKDGELQLTIPDFFEAWKKQWLQA